MKRYKDKEWLKSEIKSGKTMSSIAKESGTTTATISNYCKKFNIKKDKRHYDPDWLSKKYIDENLTMREIGSIVGVSADMISLRLKEYGISKDNDDIVNARRRTMSLRYGAPTPLESEVLKEKINKTKLKKYGTTNTSSLNSVKKKLPKYLDIFNHSANFWALKFDIPRTSVINYFKSNSDLTEDEFLKFCENFKRNLTNIENYFSQKLNIKLWNKYFDKELYPELKYKPDFKISDKIALNIDGLYWHSELRSRDKKYHFNMRKAYEDSEITLLQFREDELNYKFNIINSIINNKKNKLRSIYARKCKIKRVSTEDAKKFLEENHLMGYISSNHYGLYYENDLVLIMSYKIKNEVIIIDRYCSKTDLSIPGGFSKVLKFISKNNHKEIHYWVDLRYGSGSFLDKFGFKKERDVLSWKWTDFKYTYNRLKCRANMDERNLTERQHADELGWVKIYDAGQRLFIRRNS